MSPGFKLKPAAIAACVCLLLAFQNCSQAPEDSSMNSTLEMLTPFAYSAQPDTISHMSCSGLSDSGPDRNAYFSFRVGAYNPATGGLTVTQKFRDDMKYYSVDQRARIFGISNKNSNTNLSLSIRSAANYQQIWKEGETRAGEELDAMLPSLDSAQIAGPLAASQVGQWINYFPGSGAKRLMEGSLRYYHFENTMKDTRAALDRREAILTLGYSDTSDSMDTKLRTAEDIPNDSVTLPTNRAYGTGYFLRFALPFNYSSGEYRVISPNGGIEELDLETGALKLSNWDCNVAQFQIIRPEDYGAGLVAMTPGPDPSPSVLTPGQANALTAIRRVLRVEDWFVDIATARVMPKRTGDYCYGPLNGRFITYPSGSCLNSNTTMCPHFVSVCVKR